MKLYFVLLVVVVATASAKNGGQHNKQHMEYMKECLEKNGVSMEEVRSSFKIENPGHNVMCALHCVSQKMGMLTAEETVDLDKVVEKFGKDEKMAAAIKQCYDTTKGQGDKCESTFAFKKCFMKNGGMGRGQRRKPQGDEDDDDGNV